MEAASHEQLQLRQPWNKGRLVGQKVPLRLKDIWAIRVRLEIQGRLRELALFDLGIDSKLRACDLVKLRVRDVCHGDHAISRATVLQQKPSGRCNLKSPLEPAKRWSLGLGTRR